MQADVWALAVLAPLATWLLLYITLRLRNNGFRASFLIASVIWGMAVTALTELLSLWNGLNYTTLAIGWAAFALIIVPFLLQAYRCRHVISIPDSLFSNKSILIPVAAILFITLFIALVSPPNTFDSMTYHMPRVMHWIQNGSVAHYPTNILRQIELNPWAEYAILHLQLLSGGDHCANLVQWFSMVGCIVGVSLIAGIFSATITGQALSGFVAATIPMAILQSSSTQNDLVVSFWLVCFVYFGLLATKEQSTCKRNINREDAKITKNNEKIQHKTFQQNGDYWGLDNFLVSLRTLRLCGNELLFAGSTPLILLMSCSLSLAILTKGTAYIYALPFVLWFFVRDVTTCRSRAAVTYLLLGVVVLCLNAGHYYRNYQLFHNPLTSGMDAYSNSHVSGGIVVSNAIRNVAIHFMTPSAPINARLVSALESICSPLGIDLDDPASTWPGRTFTEFSRFQMGPSEDALGNLLHSCLYPTAVILLLATRNRPDMLRHALAVTAGFLFFCVLLRWQPWHSRLQLPLFILFSPLAGTIFSGIRRRRIIPGLVTVLFMASLPWVFCNVNRPIISLSPIVPRYPASIVTTPRRTQYFNIKPEIEQSYLDAAASIKARGAKNIGFKSGGNGWEYPLWIFTRTNGLAGPRIEHVDVGNISSTIQRGPFKPDLVVTVEGDAMVQ